RLESLEHVLNREVGRGGHLTRLRGPAELRRETVRACVHLEDALLQRPRDSRRPAVVAEVALQLSEDAWDGEARERDPARRVEPVDGLDQADARDLQEVLERLPRPRVAARERARQRQAAVDQLLAGERIAGAVVAVEEKLF